MNPTMDITAAVRPYVKRLESHADGSGNVSTNHSWNTGGNLEMGSIVPAAKSEFGGATYRGKTLVANNSAASFSATSLIFLKTSPISEDLDSVLPSAHQCHLVPILTQLLIRLAS